MGQTMGWRAHASLVPVAGVSAGVWVSVWALVEIKLDEPASRWYDLGARGWVGLLGPAPAARAPGCLWSQEHGVGASYGTRGVLAGSVCVTDTRGRNSESQTWTEVKTGEVWKGTKNGFHRHIPSRTNTKEKMEPLLNGVGDLVSKDTEEAEVTQSLDLLFTGNFCSLLFTGKVCSQAS